MLNFRRSVDPVALFDAPVHKSVNEDMLKIKQTLEREAKYAKKLIIWTDCDREGENIGMEIVQVCLAVNPRLEVLRAIFSEITNTAVQRAVNSLKTIDKRVSDAVDVRQELDLRIGAAFTRFQTLRLQRVFGQSIAEQQLVSYGSCQFPTLGFVVDRFREVDRFVPEPFWRLTVEVIKNGTPVEFSWSRGRLFDPDVADAFHATLQERPNGRILDVTNKSKSKWRPVAMDTVEMEKLASRKLRIGAKETMRLAEKLYSQGFLSYPRTETNIFPQGMDLSRLVQQQAADPRWSDFVAKMQQWGVNPRNGRKTDKAHPPIHPLKSGSQLSGNEARLFELVARHFLACLSRDARGAETLVRLAVPGDAADAQSAEVFECSGLQVLERNYLEVYHPYERWSDREMPAFERGERIDPVQVCKHEGQTSAPPLLTEADLIALMDRHGIGTDATHAEHIETIKKRLYVGLQNDKFLVPGQLGMGLVEGYDSMGLDMSKPNRRAELEADLKAICEGRKAPNEVLRVQIAKYKALYQVAMEKVGMLDTAVGNRLEVQPAAVPAEPMVETFGNCPTCQSGQMSLKRRPTGDQAQYLSCSGFPQCRFAIWFPSLMANGKKSTGGVRCGRCGRPKIQFSFKPGTRMPDGSVASEASFCAFCDTDFREAFGIRVVQAVPNVAANNPRVLPPAPPTLAATVPQSVAQPLSPRNRAEPEEFLCYCGVIAPQRTVRKDGPNKGRQFYACPNGTCKMFIWADEQNSVAPNAQVRPTPSASQAPSDQSAASAIPNCNCGRPAKRLRVQKESVNKGREFFTCSTRSGTDQKGCNFFQWAVGVVEPARPRPAGDVPEPVEMQWPPPAPAPKQRKRNNAAEGGSRREVQRRCGICRQTGHTRNHCPQAVPH